MAASSTPSGMWKSRLGKEVFLLWLGVLAAATLYYFPVGQRTSPTPTIRDKTWQDWEPILLQFGFSYLTIRMAYFGVAELKLLKWQPTDDECSVLFGNDARDAKEQAIKNVVRTLRLRAYGARVMGWFSLVLILLSLIAGISLFVFSRQITEGSGRDMLDWTLADFEAYEKAQKAPETKQKIDAAHKQDKDLQEPVSASDVGSLFDKEMISTSITRIGSIVLLLFLVQVLVPLFRYSERLSAFYHSRADALQLADDPTKLGFIILAKDFWPEFDFGKAPRTPTDAAGDIAREAMKHLADIAKGKASAD